MSADAFEKTSWGWQISQFQQQVGEWFEYQMSRFNWNPELPGGWRISSWMWNLLNLTFWFLLILFLVWVVWRLWRELRPYFYSWLSQLKHSPGVRVKTTENELSVGKWWARSQEFYRQGNYREACRCLYFAMLQHLHDKAILPQKLSRTDGEYLQLLQMSATPMQPYETLITTHEQLCFGNTEILLENYEHCQQAYQEILK
jgi:Domain of unknown function (DUF4129)